jgi:hypothetical protein
MRILSTSKIKNYSLTFVIAIILAFLLVGCSGSSGYQKSIYNDDTKISRTGDSYCFKDRIGGAKDNELSLIISAFFGKQTIWKILTDQGGTLNLKIKTDVFSGKFKVCLIDENKQVSVISEDTNNQSFSLAIPKGESFIAIVGNNANGKIDAIIISKEDVLVSLLN